MNSPHKTVLRLFAAAILGVGSVACAGEELMPMAPGPYAYTSSSSADPLRRAATGDPLAEEPEKPKTRKSIFRLLLPSFGKKKSESRVLMVEANESGPDGTLAFKQPETTPETRHAAIPGLVSPEMLAMNRIEQRRKYPESHAAQPLPLSVPATLGTEELQEFTFRSMPGSADAFPAAATQSQMWETTTFRNNSRTAAKDGSGRKKIKKQPGESANTSTASLPSVPVPSLSEWGSSSRAKQPKTIAEPQSAMAPGLEALNSGDAEFRRQATAASQRPAVASTRRAPASASPGVTSTVSQALLPPDVIHPPRSRVISTPQPQVATTYRQPSQPAVPPLPELPIAGTTDTYHSAANNRSSGAHVSSLASFSPPAQPAPAAPTLPSPPVSTAGVSAPMPGLLLPPPPMALLSNPPPTEPSGSFAAIDSESHNSGPLSLRPPLRMPGEESSPMTAGNFTLRQSEQTALSQSVPMHGEMQSLFPGQYASSPDFVQGNSRSVQVMETNTFTPMHRTKLY